MKKRIKVGLLLVTVILFVLVGCGNKSINDAQDVVDAIVADYDRSDGNQDYTKDDFSFKVYFFLKKIAEYLRDPCFCTIYI